MTPAQLRSLARLITHEGPDRVVVDSDGYALPGKVAREQHGVVPTHIFIRDDAWSLGAPDEFVLTAESMYSNAWIGKLERTSTGWRLLDEHGVEISFDKTDAKTA